MKFRVLRGNHYEGSKCYLGPNKEKGRLKGEVVESDKNLAKVFENKFEEVSDDVPATEKPDNPNSKATKIAAKKAAKTSGKLELKHRGGPKWDVVRKDTGEPINDEGLSKEDAQALIDAAKE